MDSQRRAGSKISYGRWSCIGLLIGLAPFGLWPGVLFGPTRGTLAARPAKQRLLDRVAARVNNEIITENELLLAAFGDVRQASPRLPGTAPDIRATLDAMIDERLLAQTAREEVKEIPEETIANEVEATVREIQALFPSEQAFLAALEGRGWNLERYKKHLRKQAEQAYIVRNALARRVRIGDEEVQAYSEELRRRGESLVRYRLRQILVTLSPEASPTEVAKADKRMLALLEQVRQGVPFEQLAREQSDDKIGRSTGGDLGWIGEKELQRPILEAVRSLREGQTSLPVRTGKGLHVFQLVRKQTARELLFEKRVAEVRKEWVTTLRRRAQIKILLPQLAD